MSPALKAFLAQLHDYATNNVSALAGKIQITSNEAADLKLEFAKLAAEDRPAALEAVGSHDLDTSSWAGGASNPALIAFLSRLKEYATNNVTAMEGRIQFTSNEVDELKVLFAQVAPNDRQHAQSLATSRGLDVAHWK